MYVGIISSISKQCSLFLIHILTQSLVMVLKFGAFIRVMMLKKYIYKFVNDYWVWKKGTCNEFVYSELGRFPLQVTRKLRIFKYWIKLRNTTNCILRGIYEEMSQYNDNWLINIRQELYSLGLKYIWNLSYVDDSIYVIIKQTMLDNFKQLCYSKTKTTPKGLLYQHLLNEFRLQTYLRLPMEMRYIKKCVRLEYVLIN